MRCILDIGGVGDPEPAQPIHVLVGSPDRLLAGDDHGHPRRVRDDAIDEHGYGVGEMLAVVEHDQHALAGELRPQRERGRSSALYAHTHRFRDRGRYQPTIGEHRELDPPDAVRIVGRCMRRQVPRDGLRDACLADAAGTGDRDEGVPSYQLRNRRNLFASTIQRGQP
jgi:hypothetical protein